MVGARKGSRRRSPRVSVGRVRKGFVTHYGLGRQKRRVTRDRFFFTDGKLRT